jgi:hypothetical protein
MEDDEELVRPGVGLRDVDDDERDASLASCHRIFKDMSGFLFAKRDGAVDTSDFIQQLMKGYYDGCTKAGARMPRPSIEVSTHIRHRPRHARTSVLWLSSCDVLRCASVPRYSSRIAPRATRLSRAAA